MENIQRKIGNTRMQTVQSLVEPEAKGPGPSAAPHRHSVAWLYSTFSADPEQRCCIRNGHHHPRSLKIYREATQHTQTLTLGCATHPQLPLDGAQRQKSSRSHQIHRQALQQMRNRMRGCPTHPPVAPGRRGRLCNGELRPRSQQIHRQALDAWMHHSSSAAVGRRPATEKVQLTPNPSPSTAANGFRVQRGS